MTIRRKRAGIRVDAIHDERGYRRVRRELARQYDVGFIDPNIEVVDVDLAGDRRLMLRHAVVKGAQLNEADAKRVLQHLADLWSYDVSLVEVDCHRQGAEGVRGQPAQGRRRRVGGELRATVAKVRQLKARHQPDPRSR